MKQLKMKTETKNKMRTKQLVLLVVAIAFTVSAIATEVPKMNVVALDGSKAYVTAQTSPRHASEVFVTNQNGEVVYYKVSKAAREFRTLLNLSQLKDGEYTLKLKNGKEAVHRHLAVNQGKVSIKPVAANADPVFAYKNEKLLVSYLNSNTHPVTLSVYNGNQLLYEYMLGDKLCIQQAFDVSQLKQGAYDVVLNSDQTYSYKITR